MSNKWSDMTCAVVMVTSVAFAVISAAIVPCVFWFYPETAYRSLEEMDNIFHKSKNIFGTVQVAKEEPRRHAGTENC